MEDLFKKFLISCLSLVIALLEVGQVFAQPHLWEASALGVGAQWVRRQDFLNQVSGPWLVPEVSFRGYHFGDAPWWITSGLRVSYQWQQMESASALQLLEKHWRAVPEVGLTYLHPGLLAGLSIGCGVDWRQQLWRVDPRWIQGNGLDASEWEALPLIRLQLTASVPLFEKKILWEWDWRRDWCPQDARYLFWNIGWTLLFFV